jgi:hypothetical protein
MNGEKHGLSEIVGIAGSAKGHVTQMLRQATFLQKLARDA